jgi:hypothetical protein
MQCRPAPPHRPGGLPVLICAMALLTGIAGRSLAQTPAAPRNTTVNVNYVYAASLGFGGYSLSGLTADVYTLPLSDTLQDVLRDGWSLKLLLPIQLGIYDFKGSFAGQRVSIDQQSISVVPGVELQIPLADRLVLKPFAQAGIGHTLGSGVGNPDAYIYLAGARSVAQWHAGDYTISLGTGIVFAGDDAVGPGFSEQYVSLQTAVEVRRPLGFKIGDLAPDLGVFAANYYYPAPLKFSRFLETPLRITDQVEIGFSIGSAEPFKILWFSNPRIGAGLVFGGGLNVYHINFGFPF